MQRRPRRFRWRVGRRRRSRRWPAAGTGGACVARAGRTRTRGSRSSAPSREATARCVDGVHPCARRQGPRAERAQCARACASAPSQREAAADAPSCKRKNEPFLSSASYLKELTILIGQDPAFFGAHSLRIGGATAAAAAGVEPAVIRVCGRWSSDIFEIYTRLTQQAAAHA